MRSVTFRPGGIHPRDRKRQTRAIPTRNAIIPPTSIVPLLQHTGDAARARVSPGDRVREGMLIGRRSGSRSANVHAPIPGIVRDIRTVMLPGGASSQAIVIDMDGEFDRLGKRAAAMEWDSLDAPAILRLVEECGVVALDDTPEPTHAQFASDPDASCDALIVNGAESEPYLSADHRIMVERAQAVVEGARIVARLVRPRRIVLAVEADKPDAIVAMREAARRAEAPFEIVRLRVKYPQGAERQLINAVTGREVPSGGSPMQTGVATVGVATAFAVYEAVVYHRPLIERIVTVGGDAIAQPANIKVRIGTPIADLIAECGGFTRSPAKVVVGGPLVGQTVTDLSTPVTKSTRGIIALTEREVKAAPRTPCIACGRCVEACPMGLNPSRLFKLIDHHDVTQAAAEGLFDCIECGSCGYICPSRIPLVQGLRIGKSRVNREHPSG
jgi:electron transport complex protein RnfC